MVARPQWLLALALVCLGAVAVEESDILVIDGAESLAAAIEGHRVLLVQYYAPWCGHCKALAPEYAKAAAQLKAAAGAAPGAKLAKCDATAAPNKEVAKEAGVQGFPTMKLYTGNRASGAPVPPTQYNGGRQAGDIVSFVTKRAGPPCKTLESEAEAAAWEKGAQGVRVVGLFADLESEHAATLRAIALGAADVACAVSASPQVVAMYGNKDTPTVVLLKDFDEKRVDTAAMGREALEKFISDHKTPLLQEFTQEQSATIFSSHIQTHFLLFANKASPEYGPLSAQFEEAAKQFRGRALHVVMPSSQTDVMAYFGLQEDHAPAAVIINMANGMKQYRMPAAAELTAAGFAQFEESYFGGQLKPFLKTAEAVPDADGDNVKTVVGSNFAEKVMENPRDVLLMFYAPWCGHSKMLMVKLGELALRMKKHEDKLMIAMIDATANDVEHDKVDVEGFPSLKLFKGGAKDDPIDFMGERETADMMKFLAKHATYKFDEDGKNGKPDEL
jgi:protein disulfide-isomerase A1